MDELEKKVDTKAKQSEVQAVSKSLTETKNEVKLDMAEMEQLKTDFKTSEKGKNFQSAIQDAVEYEVTEWREIDRRKNNIMMYDIEERESEEDDSEADHIKVKSILKDQLNLPNVKIAKVFRVGRRQEPTALPTPAPRKRFRPIKVIFSNEGDKSMKNYWAKKDKKVDLQFESQMIIQGLNQGSTPS